MHPVKFLVTLICVNLVFSYLSTVNAQSEENDDDEQHIVISAYRDPFLIDVPESINAVNLTLESKDAHSLSILDLIETTPGVFANGQGGIFQSYSIRGTAKNRIRTLVEGIPIVTERRAGVSSSFIDTLMLSGMDIIRGPVSTFYGSGAIGGAVNLFLTEGETNRFVLGGQNQGRGYFSQLAYSHEDFDFAITYRDIARSETAMNDQLNDAFSSTNVFINKQWQSEELSYRFFWLHSDANDIGKSNTRFNVSRNTIYPNERHDLIKLEARHESGWTSSVFYHPNGLITDNDKLDNTLTRSNNSSKDYGFTFQSEIQAIKNLSSSMDAQWGLDWFARTDVQASEIEFDESFNILGQSENLIDGSLQDIALFVSALIEQPMLHWHLGARYNIQHSQVSQSGKITDATMSAFIGLNYALSDNLTLQANVANGFRFPTLSERFFSGTTSRGDIVSANNLDKESSVNLDVGLQWKEDRHTVVFNTFIMDIDNYIERVRLSTGERSFINLPQGTIDGYEISYFLEQQDNRWQIMYSSYQGTDDNNRPLADIPQNEFSINFQTAISNWLVGINWQYRDEKNDVSDDEIATQSYNLLDMHATYQVTNQWLVSVRLNNALNELYRSSNDVLETFNTGRAISFSVTWQDN